MKVESTVTTTDIQEIEVVTGVFVKFTKTKRDDKVSFSGEVYKRTESKVMPQPPRAVLDTSALWIPTSHVASTLPC